MCGNQLDGGYPFLRDIFRYGDYHPSNQIPFRWNFFKYLFVFSVIIGFIYDFILKIKLFDVYRIIFLCLSIISFFALLIYEIEFIWQTGNQPRSNQQPTNRRRREIEHAWFNYQHADNLYHRRFNFFLVAESMLVVSFVTTLTLFIFSVDNIKYVRFAIAILGMIFTFSWFYVNKRLDWRLVDTNNRYLREQDFYYNYITSVGRYTLHSGLFMSDILPTATFFFWYYLAYLVWHNIL